MKLTIKKDFTYYHGGTSRAEYAAGTQIDTDDSEMAAVAVTEGWAESPAKKADKPTENKARKSAPENK